LIRTVVGTKGTRLDTELLSMRATPKQNANI
jgi:hypothetical protein